MLGVGGGGGAEGQIERERRERETEIVISRTDWAEPDEWSGCKCRAMSCGFSAGLPSRENVVIRTSLPMHDSR